MGAYHLIFRSLLEHLVHVHSGLLQHLFPDVGVDVGSGLAVGVTDDLHGDQRVNTALIKQGDVVVPEIVRSQAGLDLLEDVAGATGALGNLSPVGASPRPTSARTICA